MSSDATAAAAAAAHDASANNGGDGDRGGDDGNRADKLLGMDEWSCADVDKVHMLVDKARIGYAAAAAIAVVVTAAEANNKETDSSAPNSPTSEADWVAPKSSDGTPPAVSILTSIDPTSTFVYVSEVDH